jgi:ATP-dependent Lhr-like helicase
VSGFSGEQFALPEAVAALRAIRRKGPDESLVSVSGADPLNLAGILTPGPKLASLANNRVLYRDGIPLAFLEGNSTRFLEPLDPDTENRARLALLGHAEPAAHLPRLRRLAQLEAARGADEKRRRRRAAA